MIQPLMKFTHETNNFSATVTLKNQQLIIFSIKSKNNNKFTYGNSFTIDNTPYAILCIINSGLIDNLTDFYNALLSIKYSFHFNEQLSFLEVALTFCHKKSFMEIPVHKDYKVQGEDQNEPNQPLNVGQVPDELNEAQNQIKKNNGQIYYAKWSDQQGHYQGQMLNGLRHGQGKFYFNNEDVYIGAFREDMRNGYGEYLYGNGQKYEGNFIGNQMYGKGKCYMKNGGTCESFFKLNLANGPGIQTSPEGEVTFGVYKDGVMQGHIVRFYSNGDIIEWPDQTFTKYYYQNGEIFQGFNKDGLREGFGTTYWADNVREEGIYLKDERYGEFIMTYADGTVEKSFWLNGVSCSEQEFKQKTASESAGPLPPVIEQVTEEQESGKYQEPCPQNI